jgi:hypothetical protein
LGITRRSRSFTVTVTRTDTNAKPSETAAINQG